MLPPKGRSTGRKSCGLLYEANQRWEKKNVELFGGLGRLSSERTSTCGEALLSLLSPRLYFPTHKEPIRPLSTGGA